MGWGHHSPHLALGPQGWMGQGEDRESGGQYTSLANGSAQAGGNLGLFLHLLTSLKPRVLQGSPIPPHTLSIAMFQSSEVSCPLLGRSWTCERTPTW